MVVRKSFYSWLMSERNPKSQQPLAILADHVFNEWDFPKQSSDFEEISHFLEEKASFDFDMREFDAIFEQYLEH